MKDDGLDLEQCAELFRVRPVLVGNYEHSTFSNLQERKDLYYQDFRTYLGDIELLGQKAKELQRVRNDDNAN